MSQFYDEMAQLVIDMLAQYGMPMTIRRTDVQTGVPSDHPITGLFIDPTQYVIPDAQLEPADRRVVIDNTFEPLETDRILAQGSWIAIRVKKIQPADKLLGFRVDLRAG